MVKTAVVGVGYLGRFHAEKYAKHPAAELLAVVDTDSQRARETAKKLRVKALTDYRELPSLGVQAVSVASDTLTHFPIASYLLQHGIDVLVEKPMTSSVAEAQDLITLAAHHQRILQAGHLERFNPAFRAVRDLLKRPFFFEARRISPFPARGVDVDVIFDLMIHDIDIIAHLAGAPLEKVEALGIPLLTKTADVANARLTFANGAVANVTASRAATKAERTLRIFQPDLYVSLDYGNKKLKIYQKGKKSLLPSLIPGVTITEKKVEDGDALADEVASFLEVVQTRSRPVVSGEDGLKAIQLAEKIQNAVRSSASRFEDFLGDDIHQLVNF